MLGVGVSLEVAVGVEVGIAVEWAVEVDAVALGMGLGLALGIRDMLGVGLGVVLMLGVGLKLGVGLGMDPPMKATMAAPSEYKAAYAESLRSNIYSSDASSRSIVPSPSMSPSAPPTLIPSRSCSYDGIPGVVEFRMECPFTMAASSAGFRYTIKDDDVYCISLKRKSPYPTRRSSTPLPSMSPADSTVIRPPEVRMVPSARPFYPFETVSTEPSITVPLACSRAKIRRKLL